MTKIKLVVLLVILSVAFPIFAIADVVYLKNGSKIEAEETWEENGMIKCRRGDTVVGYPLESVARVETNGASYSETTEEAETASSEETETRPMNVNAPRKAPATDQRQKKEPEAVKFVKRNFFVQWMSDGYNSLKKVFDPARHGNPMTISELIGVLGRINVFFLLFLCMIPPLTVFIVSRIHDDGKGKDAPWKYIYTFFVYAVTIPGIVSIVLTAYAIFFLRQNLLELNIFVYFMPVLVMVITLVMIGKVAAWKHLPGVDRLQALFMFLFVTFMITLAIQKTRIFIVFGGSVFSLIIIAVICFVILKVSMNRMFGKKTRLEDLL